MFGMPIGGGGDGVAVAAAAEVRRSLEMEAVCEGGRRPTYENYGSQWAGGEEITKVLEDYFGGIFRSGQPSEEELVAGSTGIRARLSETVIEWLENPFTGKDIWTALECMGLTKAPE
ncbi:hypothetical protein Adt_29776 [Abeliophyllum distichum]|uniref:Uncharacterized protein n=1 Tax=Abeliophyllum distichum TaxID=126358 RepID=A0ABD1R9C9_9LAMI